MTPEAEMLNRGGGRSALCCGARQGLRRSACRTGFQIASRLPSISCDDATDANPPPSSGASCTNPCTLQPAASRGGEHPGSPHVRRDATPHGATPAVRRVVALEQRTTTYCAALSAINASLERRAQSGG